jgi:hypothetical protein
MKAMTTARPIRASAYMRGGTAARGRQFAQGTNLPAIPLTVRFTALRAAASRHP